MTVHARTTIWSVLPKQRKKKVFILFELLNGLLSAGPDTERSLCSYTRATTKARMTTVDQFPEFPLSKCLADRSV